MNRRGTAFAASKNPSTLRGIPEITFSNEEKMVSLSTKFHFSRSTRNAIVLNYFLVDLISIRTRLRKIVQRIVLACLLLLFFFIASGIPNTRSSPRRESVGRREGVEKKEWHVCVCVHRVKTCIAWKNPPFARGTVEKVTRKRCTVVKG